MKLKKGKKSVDFFVRKVRGLGKVRGLMFRSLRRAVPLSFVFDQPTTMAIHSWFVWFPFIAVWLDSEGVVQEWRLVKPWTGLVRPQRRYVTLVEVPLSKKYQFVVDFLRKV